MRSPPPPLDLECGLWARGLAAAGVDEAGRGAWAGPVVAAAVLLPPDVERLRTELAGVDDSKRLRAAERERLEARILQVAVVSVGVVPACDIDAGGILPATLRAMAAAVAGLAPAPDYLLIDHIPYALGSWPQQRLVRGESRSLSIAAASVAAKVHRDRLMAALDISFPGYGFGRHKGYGTAEHRQTLDRLGPCSEHRRSWAPLLQLRLPIDAQTGPEGRP